MDQACGPRPRVPNVAFWTNKKTSSLSCLSSSREGAFATPKQQGPEGWTRPAAHGPLCLTLLSEPTRKLALWAVCLPAAKAHKRPRRLTNGAFATPKQQGPEGRTGPAGHGPQCLTLLSEPTRKLALWAVCLPAAKAHKRPRRLTNGAFATPKQQGPEGRTRPAGHGPQCLTLLSEPTRKLALWAVCLPAAKAHKRRLRHTETAGPWRTDRACGPRPPVPNVAFWTDKKTSSLSCLSSTPEGSQTAPSPHRNSRALKDGPGLRATAPSA